MGLENRFVKGNYSNRQLLRQRFPVVLFTGRPGYVLAPRLKKCLQELAALVLKDPGDHLKSMIESGDLPEVPGATKAPHFRIGDGIDNFADPRHDGGPAAHGAGFFGDIEDGLVEAPVLDGPAGLGKGEDFGVSGGVTGGFYLVVGGTNNFSGMDDNGSNRNFVFLPGLNRLIVGMAHVEGVLAIQLGGKALGEWAGGQGFQWACHACKRG